MAEFERVLAALGAVPAGSAQKVVLPGTDQEPGYNATDPFSSLVRTIKNNQAQIDADIKKRQEEEKHKADMYKTLREAGYDPKSAYEAVLKGKLTPPGPEDTPLKQSLRDKILDKIAKGIALDPGEQKVYDETIKHKQDEDLLGNALGDNPPAETESQKKMREKILDKIARNQPLTPGEQKIYDEVIKKRQAQNTAPVDELGDAVEGGQEEMVPMIAPDGRKGKMPKSKVAAALKAGYKKR